jgi:CDP-diacylglycerol--glycerol-3-phosphate 3-phosphatidyltransferase
MTWTRAFGNGSGWLLQKIVNGLALSKISPNTLTFIGLLINIVAAFFFGYARADNYVRMFLYAGLVIIGAGLFDMVDGRVARQTNQVSVFGAFFDSVLDRYSDVALFFGLLVFYARGNRFFYVFLVAFVMTASLMVSYTRARAEALIGSCKVGFMERPRAHRPHHPRGPLRTLERHGPRPLGPRRHDHHHRHPPHPLHLPRNRTPQTRTLRPLDDFFPSELGSG